MPLTCDHLPMKTVKTPLECVEWPGRLKYFCMGSLSVESMEDILRVDVLWKDLNDFLTLAACDPFSKEVI